MLAYSFIFKQALANCLRFPVVETFFQILERAFKHYSVTIFQTSLHLQEKRSTFYLQNHVIVDHQIGLLMLPYFPGQPTQQGL